MGEGGGFKKYKRIGRWLWRKIGGRSKMTSRRKENRKNGIAREVYGKVAIWVKQQEVWEGVFEKVRMKLEEVERG